MLSKLDKKVREIVASHTDKIDVSRDYENNPLVNYLRLFQRQHRLISVLYKGLLFAFSGFVVLLSLMMLSVINNEHMPKWGIVFLLLIDVFLIIGVGKAYYELKKYKSKSEKITKKIHEFLKGDIAKLGQLVNEFSEGDSTRKFGSKKINVLKSGKKGQQTKAHLGWDRQICPNCDSAVDMLEIECPACHHALLKRYIN